MRPEFADDVLGRIIAADVDEDVMQVLSTRKQRYVLYYLLNHERASVAELADVLAGWLAVTDHRVTTKTERNTLQIELCHQYLPSLDSVGLVVFDQTQRVVERSQFCESERNVLEAASIIEHRTCESNAH